MNVYSMHFFIFKFLSFFLLHSTFYFPPVHLLTAPHHIPSPYPPVSTWMSPPTKFQFCVFSSVRSRYYLNHSCVYIECLDNASHFEKLEIQCRIKQPKIITFGDLEFCEVNQANNSSVWGGGDGGEFTLRKRLGHN